MPVAGNGLGFSYVSFIDPATGASKGLGVSTVAAINPAQGAVAGVGFSYVALIDPLTGLPAAVAPPAVAAPLNTATPVVTGTPQVGATLTVSTGAWSNSPTGYDYQWLRDGAAIPGSINTTRILTSADLGAQMSCIVTASNAGGSASATSAATTAVVDAVSPVPVNSAAPVVTGGTTVGSVLTTTNGTWTNSPTGYDYQWRRDGVNIPDATGSTYTLTATDLGTSVNCRVTATNSGGTGAAASNAITVPATVPAAPTLSLTPSATGITVSWVDGAANGSAITQHKIYRGTTSGVRTLIASPNVDAGAAYEDTAVTSGTTYYYVVAAVNGVGQGPTTAERSLVAGAPATADAAVLTAADFGNAPWTTSDTLLRYPPTTLVNPLEPGIARDETRPGTGILSQVPLSYWEPTQGDPRQDLYLVGKIHTAGSATPAADAVRTGAMRIAGFRNRRIIGHDCGSQQLALFKPFGNDDLEGIRLDFYNAVEGDAIAARGAEQGTSEVPSILTVQNVHVRGMHGTNRSHDVGTAITSITISGLNGVGKASRVDVVLSAAAPGGAPVAGRGVILGSTLIDGVKSQPLEGFNDTWEVSASPAPTATTFTLINPEITSNKPASGAGSGGKAYVLGTATGEHADGLQNENIISPGRNFRYASTRLDRVTMYAQYQGYIGGAFGQEFYASRINFVHSLKRPGLPDSDPNAYLDPMDSNSGLIYLYTTSGLTPKREFYDVRLQNRPTSSLIGGGGMYEGGGYSQSGTVAGKDVVWFRTGYPIWKGVVTRDAVPLDGSGNPRDYAPYASLGNAYNSPGYSGYSLDGTGSLSNITLSLDANPVPETLGTDGSIGWVDVAHNTVGEIIDVRVSGGRDAIYVKLKGSNLVRGAKALDYESLPSGDKNLQIQLTAKVRGVSTETATNTIIRSFSIPVGDVAAPAGASSALSATWTAVAVDPSAGTPAGTYTFADVYIGAAPTLNTSEGRYIVVCMTSDANSTTRTQTSVKMGASTMAALTPLNAQASSPTGSTTYSQFFVIEADATSTTATFEVKWNASMSNCAINVWAIRGFASGSAITAYDASAAGSTSTASGVSLSASVSSVVGGVVLAGAQLVGAAGNARSGAASANISVAAPDLTVSVVGASGNLTFSASSATVSGATLPVEVADVVLEAAGCRPVMSLVSLAPQG